MKKGTVLVAALIVSGALEAEGGPLGPTKPSQLVTLFAAAASGEQCGGYTKFATQILPDGSEVPFDVPPGMVLVVRRISYEIVGSSSYVGVAGIIVQGPNGGSFVGYSGGTTTNGAFPSTNQSWGTFDFDPGVVVKSGSCIGLAGGTGNSGNAYGYVTKDR